MNIVLFGPPGVGKGTQSALLVKKLGMVHISTGDLLRSSVKEGGALGLKAKSYMDRGELVPDEIVLEMLVGAINRGNGNFVLDGFPRTVAQARALDGLLESRKIKLNRALFMEIDDLTLKERLTGRRVCRECGAVYHVKFEPPKVEGKCDSCSGALYQRKDDSEEVIGVRLATYRKETAPLKDYYEKAGILKAVDCDGDSMVVFGRLEKFLKN